MDEIFFKTIALEKQDYDFFKSTLKERYSTLKSSRVTFPIFKSWSLVAMVLGIFTSYGDVTSSPLFLECLEKEYLPNFSEIEVGNKTRICICIERKKLNDRSKTKQHTEK